MLKRISFFLLVLSSTACGNNQVKPFSCWKEPVTGMEFVLIPKGSFSMGSAVKENNSSSAEILHKVTVSEDFWLARMEVTQKQWQIIMGPEEIHPEKPSPFRNADPEYPMVSVSYVDIIAFLEKLNDVSQGCHFRLPSEAEWEYACRAGTTSSFSCGSIISDSQANFNAEIPSTHSTLGRYLGRPMPVGSYPPNRWGLYDMHGNVWEWVADWYAPYSPDHATDPQGPPIGNQKVIRGGSWYFGADNAQSFKRRTHEPSLWGFSIGFRIVCEKEETQNI